MDPSDRHSPEVQDPSLGPRAPSGKNRPRRFVLSDPMRRAIITVLVLGALAGIFFTGRAAVTGTGGSSDLPDSVERLIPGAGQQVLRQSQVGIDLADGYDAYLQINGVEVRDASQGLVKDLGTGLVQFQPAEGRPVQELNSGQNCMIAFVWRPPDPPSTAMPVSWCFTAT